MDVVGLHPYIPHGEGLASLRKLLETSDYKHIPGDTLTELAEVVLKDNIFESDEKTFKQKRGTAIVISLHFLMLFFSLQILRKKC